MRKVLITFVFLLLCLDCIYADFYFPDGDITYNRYFDTLGYGIGELVGSKRCPNCVEYDTSLIEGSMSEDIVGIVDIDSITNEDWRYGLVRKRGLYDFVSLPPYSAVDFIYWSKNLTGNPVKISSLKVFLSRSSLNMGDLREVLYIEGEYGSVRTKYIVYEYLRNGVFKQYPGLGSLEDGFVTGTVLERVYVKPAIQFLKWEASRVEEGLLLRIYVKNVSSKQLNGILFTHSQYSLKRDFLPNEEYIYEYVIDDVGERNFGYASIYDPNTIQECIVYGESMESNCVGDSVVVSGVRESDGQYLEYIGSRSKPNKESFCITRIPYTIYSGEIILKNEEEEESEVVNEEEKTEEQFSEVLGISKLPQTSKESFLVSLLSLWYYLLRNIFK